VSSLGLQLTADRFFPATYSHTAFLLLIPFHFKDFGPPICEQVSGKISFSFSRLPLHMPPWFEDVL
jgi:hypothetical protein